MKFIYFLVLPLILMTSACSSTPEVSEDELRAPFTENKADIDNCYMKAQEKNPDLTGVLELKFLINEDGKAYKTVFLKKRSTINNKALNVCLKRLVQSWQFPSGKAIELVYPFQFEKEGSKSAEAAVDGENKTESVESTAPAEDSGDALPDEATPE